MLKEYSISDILELPSDYIPYYVGTFEDTEDPTIEWPHRHSFYSLVWFKEGNGFYVIDFQEYEIKPNRVFLVTPKQIHNWEYSEDSKGYVIMLDSALVLNSNWEIHSHYIDIDKQVLPLIENLFVNLLEEEKLNDILSFINIKTGISYLYALMARLSDKLQVACFIYNPIIEKLKYLIFEHLHIVSTKGYADKLQMSEESLNTICKDATGISVKQYILDLKITEAKRLLMYSLKNINEIAFSLGFEDSSYFSRIFKKKAGYVPSDFLKKYRKHK